MIEENLESRIQFLAVNITVNSRSPLASVVFGFYGSEAAELSHDHSLTQARFAADLRSV